MYIYSRGTHERSYAHAASVIAVVEEKDKVQGVKSRTRIDVIKSQRRFSEYPKR